MKGLLVTNDFPPMTGGVATWYARMCAFVPPEELQVLAPRLPGDKPFDASQPYRIIRRWAPVSSNPLARLIQILVLGFHAFAIVRRERIEVIHIGLLHLGPIGFAIHRLLHIPYVLYLHGGEMAVYLRFAPVRAVARAVVATARTVVVNSRFTRRQYEDLGMVNPRTEILTVSTDVERFRPDLDASWIRMKYGLDGAKIILTVGRLVQRKGHDVVLRALDRVAESVGNIRYLIVGSGPEETRLRDVARTLLSTDQVIFIGQATDDELPYLYAACDVFVMPSRALPVRDGVEGFGIVFLEAGACGKPVIGGRSGGMADAVDDGVTGILVNPTDVGEVANVLTRLLITPQEAVRLGMHGRQRAVTFERTWAQTLRRIWLNGNPQN